MSRSFILVSLLTITIPVAASAQCAFDGPVRAKGIKTSMVRAMAACQGITFASPNTSTMAGVPACTPPFPISSYRFGDQGVCTLKMNAKSEIACSNNDPDDACSNLSIKVSCKDIEDAGGVAIEGSGWTVGFVFRVTTDDASSGDFTAMDFPVQFSTHANGGTFKVNTKLSDLICVIPCNLPDTCTTWAVRSAHVIDPDGKAFATIGSSSR